MKTCGLALILWLVAFPVFADVPSSAAIASAHPAATEAGHRILEQGGNAFDAAVAVAATLAVVEPAGSGLGGGGFWLFQQAEDGRAVMLDAREVAPLAATRDMYLDKNGQPVPRRSLDGALAAAIPGTPAALAHAATKYGRLPLRTSLAPAIAAAEAGFAVGSRYVRFAEFRHEALRASPAASAVFLDDGFVPEVGHRVRQPELARALRLLAEKGAEGFYGGPLAAQLVQGVRAAGGVWQREDLARYRVIEREPLRARFKGVRVLTAPPPAGGLVVLQILNILDGYELPKHGKMQEAHLAVEAMRLAYRDRAQVLGDPAFTRVDVQRLLSPRYAARLRREVRPFTPAVKRPDESAHTSGGTNTTHFSIIDQEGNRAAVTLSLNGAFGSGFMPPGTGVLLNNEMDDFSVKPGTPNLYGLVGSKANAIAPGKRPLSSMSPTIVEDDERVVVLGTPGGSRIISMIALAVLDFAYRRGTLTDWLARPRYHHQYLPDVVQFEPGTFTKEEIALLERLGHPSRELTSSYGDMHAVSWEKQQNRVTAASDPRGEGAAEVRTLKRDSPASWPLPASPISVRP